jgi:cation diffusion facilitator CzcD-associated flavoprotein CzcO
MVKALTEQGVAAEGFEKGSDIGGLWRYENDSGTSSAYRSLHIDSSRRSIGFTDFPVPEGRPACMAMAWDGRDAAFVPCLEWRGRSLSRLSHSHRWLPVSCVQYRPCANRWATARRSIMRRRAGGRTAGTGRGCIYQE